MKILELLPLLLILSLYSTTSLAEDCDSIKMDSSVNILKKLKCKAGSDVAMNSESSESTKKNKFKIYDMRNLYSPELMKKKGFSYYSIGR